MTTMRPEDIEKIELEILLDGIFRRWGYDFRNYSPDSVRRRIEQWIGPTGSGRVSELLPRVLYDEPFFHEMIERFSITVTEMFRDPEIYAALRTEVLPVLSTYPTFKIWHAGCATGEEVYSMAVLLSEAGLYDRAHIYGTDINAQSLDVARRGIYPLSECERYQANYTAAGGSARLSDYYRTRHGSAVFKSGLKKNITFARHNLVTDGVFGEMNLIVCRNVMIYFDWTLQDRVYSKFLESLAYRGFLCLGTRETIDFSLAESRFDPVDSNARIYRALAQSSASTSREVLQ